MEYSEGRRCSICGSPITDNNPDGIGFQCRSVYKKAMHSVFMEDQDRRNKYYSFASNIVAINFISAFKKTKFRSKFRKSFYASISEQFELRGFVSGKQSKIMQSMLLEKDERWVMYGSDIHPDLSSALNKRDKFKSDWIHNVDGDNRDHIINLANKLRHA